MKKETAFKILALSLPLILLLLFEAGLRIVNYGENQDLFVEYSKNPRFLHLNNKVALRYFLMEKNATTANTDLFLKDKPADMARIFVQGESTAEGAPYSYTGSFPCLMEYQLRTDMPNLNLEVVNLAMTALSSYSLNDFVDEIIAQKPDAVIINAGQNEYYGALGVGSTSSIGESYLIGRLSILVKKTKSGQLLSHAINSLIPKPKGYNQQILMQRMVKSPEIVFGSKKYQAGVTQFEKNLNATLKKYKKAGVKVFLTNPVTNLKDQRPFISAEEPDSLNAQKYFDRATELHANGNYPEAKNLFIKAKELDLLRFRAPEEINEITKKLAQQYDNVIFVDIRKALEDYTNDQTIGQETLTEHVHPNLTGYYLIAGALINSFKEQAFLYNETTKSTPLLAKHEMPLTTFDSLRGAYTIEKLKQGWPFFEEKKEIKPDTTSLEQVLAFKYSRNEIIWFNAMRALIDKLLKENDYKEALKIAEATVLVSPYEYLFYVNAINWAIRIGEYEKGFRYAKEAERRFGKPETNEHLAILYIKTKQAEMALPYANKLITGDKQEKYWKIKTALEKIVEYEKQLPASPSNESELKEKIDALYTQINQKL